jgi:hypothetical protein
MFKVKKYLRRVVEGQKTPLFEKFFICGTSKSFIPLKIAAFPSRKVADPSK